MRPLCKSSGQDWFSFAYEVFGVDRLAGLTCSMQKQIELLYSPLDEHLPLRHTAPISQEHVPQSISGRTNDVAKSGRAFGNARLSHNWASFPTITLPDLKFVNFLSHLATSDSRSWSLQDSRRARSQDDRAEPGEIPESFDEFQALAVHKIPRSSQSVLFH